MKLADFFVELGMEGDSAVVKGMNLVDSSIENATMAAGAFIATLSGAFYGMSRLSQAASKTGAEYKKFQLLTGVGAKQLQEWENAARKASVSEDSLRSSIVGVQDAIAKMRTGGGAPRGLVFLKDLEGFDPSRMDDAFYMLTQIQRLSQKLDPAMMREFAGSFGVSADVLTAMRENAFTQQNMSGASSYTQREIDALKRMSGEWNSVLNRIEVGTNKFATKFGDSLIGSIDKAIDRFDIFLNKLEGLSDSEDLIDGLKSGFDALLKVMEMVFDLSIKFLESDFFRKGMKGISAISSAVSGSLTGRGDGIGTLLKSLLTGVDLTQKIVGPARSASSNSVTNRTENVTFNIEEARDGRDTAAQVQQILNTTYQARSGGLSE